MGGEKLYPASISRYNLGSPPHGRGKDALIAAFPVSARITPAWAGKSSQTLSGSMLSKDHPRMGGEKSNQS